MAPTTFAYASHPCPQRYGEAGVGGAGGKFGLIGEVGLGSAMKIGLGSAPVHGFARPACGQAKADTLDQAGVQAGTRCRQV